MKKLLFTLMTLILCSCGGQVIDYDENKEYIEKKKNITYYKGTPFSGTIIKNHYENGQLKEKETYKDGKANGPHISYHENGQLYIKGTYKDDKGVGTLEMYDEDGTVLTKGTWGDGRETPKWTPMVK